MGEELCPDIPGGRGHHNALSKIILFFNGDIFVKKENAEFSVEQGSLDSAEISELVGQFILSQMSEIIPKEQHGIYRDDSLMVLKTTGRGCTKMGERLAKMFRERFCLKITFEAIPEGRPRALVHPSEFKPPSSC